MDKNTLPHELQNLEIPDWVRWLAQDADGRWWGYEVEPLEHMSGWYENEIGRNILLAQGTATANWRDKLLRFR